MLNNRYEMRLSGSGGQGLILSSIILAAAATEEGYYVVQSQSYGPEARGGASRAEIIISPSPIDYPLVQNPDVLLALTEEAYDKYRYVLKEDGLIILDEAINCKVYRSRVYSFPIFKTAQKELQSLISSNMVCLGILNRMCVKLDSAIMEKYISTNVPSHTINTNLKAFHLGQSMIEYDGNLVVKER